MTYSKTFNPARYASLGSTLEDLQRLVPGERLLVTTTSPEALSKARLLIYDWLWHSGLKAEFTLKAVGPTELLVLRKPSVLVQTVKAVTEQRSQFVEELIDLWEEPKAAKAAIEGWVTEGKLQEEEASALWDTVSKIMT